MIELVEISPVWFFKYSLFLELFFMLISGLVSWFAFKVYKLTFKKDAQFLSWAFLLISLSYFTEAFLTFLIIDQLAESSIFSSLQWIVLLNHISLYFHRLLFLLGLIILFLITIKKNRKEIFWLLTIISTIFISINLNDWTGFFLLSSTYLLFITIYSYKNYIKRKNTTSLLILLAFSSMLLACLSAALMIPHNYFYVTLHLLNTLAYTLLLVNFYLVLRK